MALDLQLGVSQHFGSQTSSCALQGHNAPDGIMALKGQEEAMYRKPARDTTTNVHWLLASPGSLASPQSNPL
jgi:hypothetical protein